MYQLIFSFPGNAAMPWRGFKDPHVCEFVSWSVFHRRVNLLVAVCCKGQLLWDRDPSAPNSDAELAVMTCGEGGACGLPRSICWRCMFMSGLIYWCNRSFASCDRCWYDLFWVHLGCGLLIVLTAGLFILGSHLHKLVWSHYHNLGCCKLFSYSS